MKTATFTQPYKTRRNNARGLKAILALAFLLLLNPFSYAQDVLVGLTSNGGPEGKGTAFSFKTDTKAYTVLKGFADWGANPVNSLVRASDGQLYGMAPNGGTYNYGTLFRI